MCSQGAIEICIHSTMDLNSTQLDNATLALFQNKEASTALSVIYVIVILISFPSNSLSLWLLLFRTTLTPSTIYMINLTITDLVICLFLPFQIVYQLNGYNWIFGENMCSVVTVMFYSNMYCSILTMTAISLSRYIGVVCPMTFENHKNRYALMVCLAMWVAILIVMYPLERTDLTYKVKELNITTCFDILKKSMLPSIGAWAAFLFTLFVLLFMIPFILTVYCYTRVILKLLHPNQQQVNRDSQIQKKRAILLVTIVLFVFITCFAPNNIILLTHMIGRLYYDKSFYMAYKLTLSLSCLNSCLDPFIYYFASTEFRKKLRQVLNLQSTLSIFSQEEHEMMARGGEVALRGEDALRGEFSA
ncbi:P2RY8 protein, partial [Amia calva]|nr:P2RY8 protein [Amia calva]